jgi:hypothetical protein
MFGYWPPNAGKMKKWPHFDIFIAVDTCHLLIGQIISKPDCKAKIF